MEQAASETVPAPDEAAGEDEALLERGRLLFAGPCAFVMGAVREADLPTPGLPEVAFAGRSNVGKSSLVNALTGRKTLARTSDTPGRTREINFFLLGERLHLVDLPGYGYARASKGDVDRWNRLIRDYLRGRTTLRRVCLLVDARHGLKPSDEDAMTLMDRAAVSYQVVLTKLDKIPAAAAEAMLADTAAKARLHVAAHPAVLATSAREGTGIALLRAEIARLAETNADRL